MKKFYYLLLFLFLFGVCTVNMAECASMSSPDNGTSNGIELFESGQYKKAYDMLLDAVQKTPAHIELYYYLGQAAFKTGNFEMAIMAFDYILSTRPEENRVKLEMARAFHMLKADDMARRYCSEVLESSPSEKVKKKALKFLSFLNHRNKGEFFPDSFLSEADQDITVQTEPALKEIEPLIMAASESREPVPPPRQQKKDKIGEGIEVFKSGQYIKAYDILLSQVDDAPENLELNFYLGRAAFETGNYEMAIMAFERILIARPDENRVKLEMARAFHMLQSNDMARHYCREVLESNPPESVKKNIMKFLAAINKKEQKHFLSGSLSVGTDWNSNVWASPGTGRVKTIIGDIDLTGPSTKKTQDWVYNAILVLNHTYRPPYQSKDTWKTQGIVYSSKYEETSALDLKLAGVVTGYETALPGNKRLNISLILNKIALGQATYLDTKGIQATLKKAFSKDTILTTSLKHELKRYIDYPEKDAGNTSVSANLLHHREPFWYNAGVKFENEDAKEDEISYSRLAANFSISRELPFELMGSLSYNTQFTVYKDDSALFDKWRQDHQHTAGCSLRKKIWQSDHENRSMTLDLNFQHIWAFSNIELYDYRKDLMQFFLTYNF